MERQIQQIRQIWIAPEEVASAQRASKETPIFFMDVKVKPLATIVRNLYIIHAQIEFPFDVFNTIDLLVFKPLFMWQ